MTATEVNSFELPFNSNSWVGLALDPASGNLWYGSDGSTEIVELTKSGAEVRRVNLALQGVDQGEISGLAFDAAGNLLVSSTQGVVYRVDLEFDPAIEAPALSSMVAAATNGTPPVAAQPSANPNQVIELHGANFAANSEVVFTTAAGTTPAAPLAVNAAGTVMQVRVPATATTGAVEVVNLNAQNLGFNGGYPDGIYRGVTLTFTPSAATASLSFADGGGLEGVGNESWGFDNVVVTQAAATKFSDSFEGGAKAAWSSATTDTSSKGIFSQFSGPFNGTQTLSLTGLTPGVACTLTFDLYILDSWDGVAAGDRFKVSADGTVLMDDAFSSSAAQVQTFNASAGINLQIVAPSPPA
ncbi:MAG: hypothetical protein WDN25_17800 [Acetobacteraceae bacterium]